MPTSITGQGISIYPAPDDALSSTSKNPVQNKVIDEELSDVKNAIGENEEKIRVLENNVNATSVNAFKDDVVAGRDYKGYVSGYGKVAVEIPSGSSYAVNVVTESFDEYELYALLENTSSYANIGTKATNSIISLTNDNQYKIVSLTLWAKAANVISSGSFTFSVATPNTNGLIPRMTKAESDIDEANDKIDELEERVENIAANLSGEITYSFTDNVIAGSDYKGYATGKKIEVEIPGGMNCTYRVDTDCFTRYKFYYFIGGTYYGLSSYVDVGQDCKVTAGYRGEGYNKVTIYVPKINDLTSEDNVTSNGSFTFSIKIQAEESYDITKLNPREEMLPKIQNGRVSVEVSGKTGENRPKCLTLVHFSDIHADATNLARIIEFCGAYTDYLDDIVCTGDLVRDHAIADGVEEDFTFWSDCGAENVLSVIGNHDTAAITNGTIDWRGFGQLNTYNKYFAPFIANWNVTQPQNASTVGECYYYKDYSNYNIRLIILDCMYYDQAQDDWFASVLESARTSGYAVIVCAHSIGKSGVGTSCVFNSLIGDAGPVIVDTSTYIYNANVHTKVDAFISAGGTFICFLGGHFHKDHFGLVSDTVNPQPYILVDTAAYNAPLRDHAVVKFERSQDCFNFVSFDTALHLIKIVRVGYQHDCWMREKNPIAYDYENHTLI